MRSILFPTVTHLMEILYMANEVHCWHSKCYMAIKIIIINYLLFNKCHINIK